MGIYCLLVGNRRARVTSRPGKSITMYSTMNYFYHSINDIKVLYLVLQANQAIIMDGLHSATTLPTKDKTIEVK